MGETKVCNGCGETKALEAFHRSNKEPDGRRQPCAACRMAANAARRPPPPTTKICKRCKQEFPKESFPRYGKKNNIWAYCRPCINARAVEQHAAARVADPLRFVCRRCGEGKAPEDFLPTKGGGRTRLCRNCHSKHSVEINARKRAALPQTKTCRDCGQEKSRADFPHFGRVPATRCKPCFRIYENATRAKERENAPRRNHFFRPYTEEASGLLVKKCTRCKLVKPVDTEFGRR